MHRSGSEEAAKLLKQLKDSKDDVVWVVAVWHDAQLSMRETGSRSRHGGRKRCMDVFDEGGLVGKDQAISRW